MRHPDDGKLNAYLDGEGNARQRARLARHLEGCTDCRRRLEQAGALARAAGALLGELAPPRIEAPSWRELEARAAARAAAASTPRPWTRRRPLWAAGLALAFLAGWLVRGNWRGAVEPRPAVVASRAEEAPAPPVPPRPLGVPDPDERETPAAEASAPTSKEAGGPAAASPAGPVPAGAAKIPPPRRREAPAERPAAGGPAVPPAVALRAADEEREQAPADPGRAAVPLRRAASAPSRGAVGPSAVAAPTVMRPAAEVAAEAPEPAPSAGPSAPLTVELEEAAAWLGAPPLTLADLTLLRAEVEPRGLLPGAVAGHPALRLVYGDPAGRQVALVEQWWPDGESGGPDPAPSVVERDGAGRGTCLWRRGPYRLALAAELPDDELLTLAARVR